MDILITKGAALGYHLEVDRSKLWWPPVYIELLGVLQIEFIERDDLVFNRPVEGVKYLGTPIGSEALVADFLRKRMALAKNLLTAVEELKGPHISTKMHWMCESVVQVVNVFRATRFEQTAPLLAEFDATQKAWTNRFPPTAAYLPAEFLKQSFLDRPDGGLAHLPAEVIAIQAYVGSKIDTAHAFAQLPGNPSAYDMTADVPALLEERYEDFFVVATESELVPSIL